MGVDVLHYVGQVRSHQPQDFGAEVREAIASNDARYAAVVVAGVEIATFKRAQRFSARVWRSVGLLHGGTSELPVIQHVTTACHHCVEPACLQGCPVKAFEKDPVTGIVKHLDDQCIGCQYCMLKCPYDVPKYSKSKGIVRKCDMCSDRLAADEAPAGC